MNKETLKYGIGFWIGSKSPQHHVIHYGFSMYDQFKNMKPLSKGMIELLMDCHERELMDLPPYDTSNAKYARGLLKRNLLKTAAFKRDDGKSIICLYTTKLGRNYLSSLK